MKTTVKKTLTLTVEFDYSLGEPARRPTRNDPGEPGEPPWAEITSVCVGDIDITKAMAQDDYSDLETLVLESLDSECGDYEPWVDDGWRLRREAC